MPATPSVADRLQGYLRENGVCFTLAHRPLAYTPQALAAMECTRGFKVAKSVMAIADGRPVMLVIPAACDVRTNTLARELGVLFGGLADEEYCPAAFLDCEVG